MNALGIIFANIHETQLRELTKVRTIASVPFGGRYRLIDFALSAFVNAGIDKVGVVTRHNYQSLIDHLSNGLDWDLARKNGGLVILPPFGIDQHALYNNRLEALQSAVSFIERSDNEYAVLSDADCAFNIDLSAVFAHHKAATNDITLVVKRLHVDEDMAKIPLVSPEIDRHGRVIALADAVCSKTQHIYLNICILKRELLLSLIKESLSPLKLSFTRQVLGQVLGSLNVGSWQYKSEWLFNDTKKRFFENNMSLLGDENPLRQSLFDPKRPIMTKVKDSVPTKFLNQGQAAGCIIADGCEINGKVEGSVLFRSVEVRQGARVKNCVLMQDTVVGEGAQLEYVIADKNVVFAPNCRVIGTKTDPIVIDKNAKVE